MKYVLISFVIMVSLISYARYTDHKMIETQLELPE